jgi:hypothetical protein
MRRPIADTLRDIRGGEVLDELEAKLQELVQAVQSTNGSGQIKLTIDVKPMKGSTEAVVVTDNIVLKKPAVKSSGTVMFPTVEGNLQRHHPKQDDLPGISLASDRGVRSA